MEKKITFNTLNKYEIVKGNLDQTHLGKSVLLKKIIVKGDDPSKFTITIKNNRVKGIIETNPHSLLTYREYFIPNTLENTLTLDISKNSKFQDIDTSSTVEMMKTGILVKDCGE
ncbi:MAG: hypothetical protein HY062_18865 [Bacteroidetes bacterium]|nr:hypothetical protein [Bacteroidota bacterium]